ncbi:hypothetical protein F2Q69_00056298 [Brassica cretica]|uniref:Uncharacterized protein n=1 Tax=Brassica cretica TaxID=69181 RepID=A0A8S9NA91_BRACR|nr:hypothetical protein F2Q69_00056298 [Brassica cretica]
MGRDASCMERSCVWSQMCAELAVMRTWAGSVVNRKQYEKNRELVKLEIVGSWIPKDQDGAAASEGASEIGSTNGLR